MNKVLTAMETEDCPPHYWEKDDNGLWYCAKCPEVKDFTKLQYRFNRKSISLAELRERGGESE